MYGLAHAGAGFSSPTSRAVISSSPSKFRYRLLDLPPQHLELCCGVRGGRKSSATSPSVLSRYFPMARLLWARSSITRIAVFSVQAPQKRDDPLRPARPTRCPAPRGTPFLERLVHAVSRIWARGRTIVHASRQKSVCGGSTIFLASFTYLSISSRPAVFCGTGLRTEKPILPVSLRAPDYRTPKTFHMQTCGRCVADSA